MTALKSIMDCDVAGKTVLVRADLNVPMKDGHVTDATRITRFIPTVRALIEKDAKVVILSHFGRPKGKVVQEMSLEPVADALSSHLGLDVSFAYDCVGDAALSVTSVLENGEVCLLENLRFHPEEEKNDLDFASKLAELGDLYVNDAFSCAHRAHASTHALATQLPVAAGLSLAAEIDALNNALTTPSRPVAALVGGAKVSSKLSVLEFLLPKVDYLIIGGGMANTFLYAMGKDVGASLCEKDLAETALKIMANADEKGCKIILPREVVVASKLEENVHTDIVTVDAVPSDKMILDVAPRAANDVAQLLQSCQTVLWNGPMGAFEFPPFDQGTNLVAQAAARETLENGMISVAGGGDTVAALNHAGVLNQFSYVSTAGGAFLEWLEGKELPGVQALYENQ